MSWPQAWSTDMDDALRQGLAAGLSHSQIAHRMESSGIAKVTRNACIGRAARLGLVKPREDRSPRASHIPRKSRRSEAPRHVQARPPIIPEPLPIPPASDVASIAFADLEPHHCRWIPFEPSQGFCGLPRVPGQSYCAGHCARAFTSAVTPMRKGEAKVTVGDTTLAAIVEEFLQPA